MGSRLGWFALSLIGGLIMIALGVIFVARPGLGLATMLLWFGIFTIAYGVVQALAGIVGRAESRGWAIFEGLMAVIVGVVVLVWPGLSALTALYIIAAWMIVAGVGDLAGAFMRGISAGQRIWLVIAGIAAMAVGIFFFVHPAGGAIALLWLIGIYLIAFGVLRILHGFSPPPQVRAA